MTTSTTVLQPFIAYDTVLETVEAIVADAPADYVNPKFALPDGSQHLVDTSLVVEEAMNEMQAAQDRGATWTDALGIFREQLEYNQALENP